MFRLWVMTVCAPIFGAQILSGLALAGGLAATALAYGAAMPAERRR
jgi:hypothetical protein